jgi:hypothetical protein
VSAGSSRLAKAAPTPDHKALEVDAALISHSPVCTAPRAPSQTHKLWAVYLPEKHPPQGAQALEWLVLTTIEVGSFNCDIRGSSSHPILTRKLSKEGFGLMDDRTLACVRQVDQTAI